MLNTDRIASFMWVVSVVAGFAATSLQTPRRTAEAYWLRRYSTRYIESHGRLYRQRLARGTVVHHEEVG